MRLGVSTSPIAPSFGGPFSASDPATYREATTASDDRLALKGGAVLREPEED